jgi:hypothetical protein
MIRKTPRIAAIAASVVLAGGAAAAAVGSPPEAADKGLTTAEEHSGQDVPMAPEAVPTPDDDATDVVEVDEVETDEVDDVEATEDEGTGPVDNHGAAVSAVAQDDSTTGREHGEAVSTVARSDAGKSERAGGPSEAGAAHGQGHGKP